MTLINGTQDDTKAIDNAIGTNTIHCGKGRNGSTTRIAIVVLPARTCLVSSIIPMTFGT
jgi:hypothetical protein